MIVTFKDNMSTFDFTKRKSSQKYTIVSFKPDLDKFTLTHNDVFSENSLYKQIIKQRLINLSICFPEITFYFDGKSIKSQNSKQILTKFGDNFEFQSTDNCIVAVYPNSDDTFRFYSYLNGLRLINGGNHIDLISNEITNIIREKLSKKYKLIKPGEIKNKLFIVFYGKGFKNPKFDSQTKEKLTNSTKEIRDFIEGIDLEKLSQKILKNDNIIDPIVEIYKIKEEFKKRQEIDSLQKTTKKIIKNKKYLPATENNTFLLLAEGDSASGSISAVLGRENMGYIALRGIPLSCYAKTQLDVLKNNEMKLITDVLNIDLNPKELPESENWFNIEINSKKVPVNENDDILINNFYYSVKDIKNKEKLDSKPKSYTKNNKLIRRNKEEQILGYDSVVIASDQDLDGFRIRGIILSYFVKYAPDVIRNGKLYQLRTPIVVLKKNKKITHYFMTFDEFNEWCSNNDVKQFTISYKKGLGAWKKEELIEIFENEDKSKFFDKFEWNKDLYKEIDEWFADDKADIRKEKLQENFFSILNI